MKAEARGLVRRAIDQAAPAGIRERAVRINSVDSGLALGDLTEVVRLKSFHTSTPPRAEYSYKYDYTNHLDSSNPQTSQQSSSQK
jgi:citrate lyase subunit beta-like protein